jgi:hypothetical protein
LTVVSGVGFSKETMMISKELEDAFPKATFACAKKCRTIQYRIAEPCLANAYQEIRERDECYGHLKSPIGIRREKSLEAIKICRAAFAPTPPELVSLPLSAKKCLQDKFNIPDDRVMVKCYGSEGLLLAIELKKGVLKTESRGQSGSLISDKLRFQYRKEVSGNEKGDFIGWPSSISRFCFLGHRGSVSKGNSSPCHGCTSCH